MNNGEKATTKQIKKLYSLLLSRYREKHGIVGGLATDTIKQVMGTFKEEKGITSFSSLGKTEISRMIDEIENPLIENEKEEVNQETQMKIVNPPREVKREDGEEKTQIEQIAEEMQIAVRHATRIAVEEVKGKIEAQGLASFIQKLATTMFLANKKAERESTSRRGANYPVRQGGGSAQGVKMMLSGTGI